MELIEDQQKSEIEKLKAQIAQAESFLQQSEKYERLKDNDDWKQFLIDLEGLSDVHRREIENALSMLSTKPFTEREGLFDFIFQHQLMRSQVKGWVSRIRDISKTSSDFQAQLPMLRGRLNELKENNGHG